MPREKLIEKLELLVIVGDFDEPRGDLELKEGEVQHD